MAKIIIAQRVLLVSCPSVLRHIQTNIFMSQIAACAQAPPSVQAQRPQRFERTRLLRKRKPARTATVSPVPQTKPEA